MRKHRVHRTYLWLIQISIRQSGTRRRRGKPRRPLSRKCAQRTTSNTSWKWTWELLMKWGIYRSNRESSCWANQNLTWMKRSDLCGQNLVIILRHWSNDNALRFTNSPRSFNSILELWKWMIAFYPMFLSVIQYLTRLKSRLKIERHHWNFLRGDRTNSKMFLRSNSTRNSRRTFQILPIRIRNLWFKHKDMRRKHIALKKR